MGKTFIHMFFLFVAFNFTKAQNGSLNFTTKEITQADGLSQGSNYAHFEDSKGFMWITAIDALNRYDGSEVKVYNLNKYFKNCEPIKQAYGFVEDANSDIYIGSEIGLYKYIREDDKFIFISKTEKTGAIIPLGFYKNLLWCIRGNEVLIYNTIENKIGKYGELEMQVINSNMSVYNTNNYYAFKKLPILTADGKIFYFTNSINYFDCNSKVNICLKSFGQNISPNCIYRACENNGIITVISKFGLFEIQNSKIQKQEAFNTSAIQNLMSDFVKHKNLIAWNDKTQTVLFDTISKKKNIVRINPQCNDLFFDKSGRLWFADAGRGILIYSLSQNYFNKIIPGGIYNGYIKSVGFVDELPDGKLLLNSILVPFDRNTKQFTVNKIEKYAEYYSCLDSNRNFNWAVKVYMENSQLSIVKEVFGILNKDNKFQPLIDVSRITQNQMIKDIALLNNNIVIITNSAGTFCYNIAQNKFSQTLPNELNNCFAISILSENKFAISCIKKKLYLIEKDLNDNFKIAKEVLNGTQAFYIEPQKYFKKFWIGAEDGIYITNEKFELEKKLDLNSGLTGNYIYGILTASDSTIWVSHQKGLSCINPINYNITNFNPEDGLQGYDYNNRAFLKSRDGTLVFGGMDGFNYFKPPVKFLATYKPVVYIGNLKVNNKEVEFKNFTKNSSINFKSNENSLSFKLLIKDLESAEQQEIVYKLNNEQLHRVSNVANINFSNLASGSYTFSLGYINKFMQQPIWQKQFLFTINTPFYKTIWFWILMSILFSAFIFYYFSRLAIQKQRRVLEQQKLIYDERLRMTADLHDDIGASLSSLQINSAVAQQFIEKQRPEAQTMMQKVEEQSKELAEKIGDFIWSSKSNEDQLMNLSTRIKTYAYDILASLEIEYEINIDDGINTKIQDSKIKKNILLIVKEAVNNIAKYSKANNVLIEMKIQEEALCIKIEDNGIGFDANSNAGNGLGNMKNRAKEINAEINIESTMNKGAKITLYLYLGTNINKI